MSTNVRSQRTRWTVAAAGTPFLLVHAIVGCASQPAAISNDTWLVPPPSDAGGANDAVAASDAVGENDAVAASDSGGDAPNDAATAYDAAAGEEAEAAAALTCSPATSLDPRRPFDDCVGGACLCRTYAPDGGTLVQDYGIHTLMNITSFLLIDPMKAGQPYSLSVSVANSRFYGDIEFWGTNSECGPGLERLYSAPVDTKVYCADVLPTKDYTYVLFVERLMVDSGAPASEHSGNMLACPTGRCPKP